MANKINKSQVSVNVTFTDNVKGELNMPIYIVGNIIHFNVDAAFQGRKSNNLFEPKEFEGHKYDVLQALEGEVTLKQLVRKNNGIPFKGNTIAERCAEIKNKVWDGWTLKIVNIKSRPINGATQTICVFEEMQG